MLINQKVEAIVVVVVVIVVVVVVATKSCVSAMSLKFLLSNKILTHSSDYLSEVL